MRGFLVGPLGRLRERMLSGRCGLDPLVFRRAALGTLRFDRVDGLVHGILPVFVALSGYAPAFLARLR